MKGEPILKVNNIEVVYNDVILVLKGLSLEVRKGQIVALLGPNGAGKTTTLKAISGLLKSEEGEVTDGTIEFMNEKINGLFPEEIVRRGILQVMEGRHVFETLTVDENLVAAAAPHGLSSQETKKRMETVFDYFPRLREKKDTLAGYLSGGEQQMLVIGRALMVSPRLMLLDEPSLGLAPLLVKQIFDIIKRINEELGTAILLVEQNAQMAFRIADYGYIMENGHIVLDDTVEKLKENEDVKKFFLGVGEGGERIDFSQVKHYKRRKRWLQ